MCLIMLFYKRSLVVWCSLMETCIFRNITLLSILLQKDSESVFMLGLLSCLFLDTRLLALRGGHI